MVEIIFFFWQVSMIFWSNLVNGSASNLDLVLSCGEIH